MAYMESIGNSPLSLDFSRGKIGDYQAGWRALIEGMASKDHDVASRFSDLMRERKVPELHNATAALTENVVGEQSQSRDYLVVERGYPNGAKCTLAVRISQFGGDLYVEWLHYELGVVNMPLVLGAGCLTTIATFGIALIVSIPAYLWAVQAGHLRRGLTHFEKQDSWALRAAVDASLRQAIDQAGISKELVRDVPVGQFDMGKKSWI